jgi:chromosome segregation ATPase
MNETSQNIDPKRLKSFVRHMCVIAKKHKDREDARSDLQTHIKNLKKLSPKKKGINNELRELNRKISFVLEKEMQLLGVGRGEREASKELMNNVVDNREKIRNIKNSINDVKGKLENYIQTKTEREKDIEELEKKIRGKASKKKNLSLLKNKLKTLEATYNKLKKKGVDVSRVKSKINDLKLKLDFT